MEDGMRKARGALMLAGSAVGLVGVVRQIRSARQKSDPLMLVNALGNAIVVITGAALALRGLRKGRSE
ncbi:hypothetical protein SAMN05444320_106203 [Streptoalloteichus hindustanus]|uniref:Uncharacterized protein n=2 Tax=Streptoalloteichus hindustanus TaxID=2017 RepID=A0A1M5GPK2_STRHI|nr:hypothetical protein SAMN05444320_106203 [Streptoalloteichus hindustanus]